MFAGEAVHVVGEAGGDVLVAQMLAHHVGVLALDQRRHPSERPVGSGNAHRARVDRAPARVLERPEHRGDPAAARRTPPGGESSARFTARGLAAFRGLAPLYVRWPLLVSSRGVARVLMEHGGCEDAATVPNCTILRVTLADSDGGEDFVVAGIDRLGTAAGLA